MTKELKCLLILIFHRIPDKLCDKKFDKNLYFGKQVWFRGDLTPRFYLSISLSMWHWIIFSMIHLSQPGRTTGRCGSVPVPRFGFVSILGVIQWRTLVRLDSWLPLKSLDTSFELDYTITYDIFGLFLQLYRRVLSLIESLITNCNYCLGDGLVRTFLSNYVLFLIPGILIYLMVPRTEFMRERSV